MAHFRELKSKYPTLKQSEIAKKLGKSTSTLQQYRNDINMPIFIEFLQTVTKEGKFQLIIPILKMTSKDHK